MLQIIDIIMPASIGIIMFGIGLELRFNHFKRVFLQPKAVITGLICQLFLLPLLAIILVWFWPMNPVYKVGLILLAACPGGTSSNLVTKMLNGRVALSVSLTAFNSFLILFTIPFFVELGFLLFANEIQRVELGFWTTMREILFTVIIPVLAGMLINEYSSESLRNKLHKPLKYVLPLVLLIAFIAAVILDKSERNIRYLEQLHLFLPLVILNIITIFSGYFVARKFQLSHESGYTIGIEMGLQNSVLALYIANHLLNNGHIGLIAILYSSFSLFSTFGFGYILKISGKDKGEERKN